MNVTGTTTNFDPNLAKAGYNGIDETKVVADSRQAEAAPLLFGSNILVSYGISDVEALVARLKNENADTHVQMKLKSLGAIADGISAQQLKALSKALAIADSVKNLEMSRDGLNRTIDIDNGLLKELELKTETLTREIETARANQEEYNKNIQEQKARKAELEAKIDQLEADTAADHADEIAGLRDQVAAIDKSIAADTKALDSLAKDISDKTAELASAKTESDEYRTDLADASTAVESTKREIAKWRALLTPLLASIGESTLKDIAADILDIAPPDPDSPHDRKELEKNTEAMDVLAIIRDRLDAIAKDILDEVAQKRIEMV